MTFALRIFGRNWKLLARFALSTVVTSTYLNWLAKSTDCCVFQKLRDEEGKKLGLQTSAKSGSKDSDVKMTDAEVQYLLDLEILYQVQSSKKIFCSVFVCRRQQMEVENHPQ